MSFCKTFKLVTMDHSLLQCRMDQIENPPPVLDKRDFVRRYALGEFGNASPTWNFLKEFHDDFYAEKLNGGLYHLRNRVAGGSTYYNLISAECLLLWQAKSHHKDWYVSEMAPTAYTILQGELTDDPGGRGLYLNYSTVAKPMREALALQSRHSYGIMTRMILRSYLCPNSMEWLDVLLRRYPEHVIEFSTYSKCWGTLPHYNTVFWEVRRY